MTCRVPRRPQGPARGEPGQTRLASAGKPANFQCLSQPAGPFAATKRHNERFVTWQSAAI